VRPRRHALTVFLLQELRRTSASIWAQRGSKAGELAAMDGPRDPRRTLRDRCPPRFGRNGRGIQGPGRHSAPHGRRENSARTLGIPECDRAVRARGEGRLIAGAPKRLPHLPARVDLRGAPVHRDGVRSRRNAAHSTEPGAARAEGGPRHRDSDWQRVGGQPHSRCRASGHQT
jgi:hypothetical protein